MWTYRQSDGELLHDGQFQGTGYSGAVGEGRNNPDMDAVALVGPIPRGFYTIGDPYDHPHLGPVVMNLDPVGHDAHGRTAFRIHGDNQTHTASEGCIVLGPSLRREIVGSHDHKLEVIE